jgi:hypothetical protein
MTGTRRLLIYGLPALIIGVMWWSMSWTADAATMESSAARLDSAVQANRLVAGQLRSARDYRDGGAASQAELDSVRSALPDSADIAGFVVLNSAAAEAAGVVVSDLAPSAPGALLDGAPAGTRAVGLDLSVLGTQEGLDAYLVRLKTLSRAIVVDSLSINRSSGNANELTIHARIFHLDPPANATR